MSVPGQTRMQDASPCVCLSPYRSSIKRPPSVVGVRACCHVWECSAGEGASLLSKPHHISGKIPYREEEPPTDWRDRYLRILQSPGLATHNPHHITLFCTKNTTAFKTACAIQNCFHLSDSHSSYHPVLPFPITFLSPSYHLPPLWHYSRSWVSISCIHPPANPHHTLTWKHQDTVKTRPAVPSNCWNTQAGYKLVVAGLWGGRHSQSSTPQRWTKETPSVFCLWYFSGLDNTITDGVISWVLLHVMLIYTLQFIAIHYWWRPKAEIDWKMIGHFHGRYTHSGF